MLRAGHRARPHVPLLAGDALRLPFADGVFDAVNIPFALRNVGVTVLELPELARETRSGGRPVVCELIRPSDAQFLNL